MSASKPAASVPIVSPRFIDSAASDVAPMIASIGFWPAATRATISRAFWPCAPATASVPIGILSPAASAFLNDCGDVRQRVCHRREALVVEVAACP